MSTMTFETDHKLCHEIVAMMRFLETQYYVHPHYEIDDNVLLSVDSEGIFWEQCLAFPTRKRILRPLLSAIILVHVSLGSLCKDKIQDIASSRSFEDLNLVLKNYHDLEFLQ